jgi:hypothetical protein
VQGGSAIPAKGHGEVLRDAEAVVIESSEIVFGRGITLTRSAGIIFERFAEIARETLCVFIEIAEKELGVRHIFRGE